MQLAERQAHSHRYKAEMEAWVSGLSGGSILECLIIVTVPVTAFALWSIVVATQKKSKLLAPSIISIPVEIIVFLLPTVSAMTLIANFSQHVTCCELGTILIVSLSRALRSTGATAMNGKIKHNDHKPFLTVYRSLVTLITCIAILAVDFPIFPRRFAKVETWGISLMDIGVGSFIFAQGLMQARKPLADAWSLFVQQFRQTVIHCVPLFALGIIRLIAVKGSNYQEHASEYGIHWNFFFTLAFLPSIVLCLRFIFAWLNDIALGAIIVSGYQYLLSVGHLQDWILNAERVGLLTSNKEGLCSLFGYTAIFCIGRQLGSYLFYPSNRRLDEWRSHVIPTLTCLVSISWSVFYILNTYFDCFPSRRMVNAMYILCTSAFNLTSILLCLLTEQYCLFIANKPTPLLLESINHNQLAVFLIANLLTGLINKSMYTLYADNWTAICVLLAYTIITVLISLWLHSRRIYLRL